MSYAKSLLDETRTGAHMSPSQADCERSAGDLRPLGQGRMCGVVWDGWLCWPPTLAGAVIKQPCPDIHQFNTEQFAFRTCLPNATWFGSWDPLRTDSAGWSNYSLCVLSSSSSSSFSSGGTLLSPASVVTSTVRDVMAGRQELGGETLPVQTPTVAQILDGTKTPDTALPLDDVIGAGVHGVSAVCLLLALVLWVTLRLTDRLVTRRYLMVVAIIVTSFLCHTIVLTSRLRAIATAMSPTPTLTPFTTPLPPPLSLPLAQPSLPPQDLGDSRPRESTMFPPLSPRRAAGLANAGAEGDAAFERRHSFPAMAENDDSRKIDENVGVGGAGPHRENSRPGLRRSRNNKHAKNKRRNPTKKKANRALQRTRGTSKGRRRGKEASRRSREKNKRRFNRKKIRAREDSVWRDLSQKFRASNMSFPSGTVAGRKRTEERRDSTERETHEFAAKTQNGNVGKRHRASHRQTKADTRTLPTITNSSRRDSHQETFSQGDLHSERKSTIVLPSTTDSMRNEGRLSNERLSRKRRTSLSVNTEYSKGNNYWYDEENTSQVSSPAITDSWVTLCQVGRAFYLLTDLSVYAFLFAMSLYYTLVVLDNQLTFNRLVTMFLFGVGLPVVFVTFTILLYTFLPTGTGFGMSCVVESLTDEFHWAVTAPKLLCIVLSMCLMTVSTYGFWRLHVPALHASSETFYARQGVLKTLTLLLACSLAELFFLVTEYQRLYGWPADSYVTRASTALFAAKGLTLAVLFCFADSEVLHGTCCAFDSEDGDAWLRATAARELAGGGEGGGREERDGGRVDCYGEKREEEGEFGGRWGVSGRQGHVIGPEVDLGQKV